MIAPPPVSIRFSVAPMMDWTDRHCRVFHRGFTRRAVLFTEMITAAAAIHGRRERLLGFDPLEKPIALQLGGSDPEKLRIAAAIGAEWGYDEINLNVGCPSDRVQEGRFGACLMREPTLVAECMAALAEGAAGRTVSVKCRIGVDEQDPAEALPDLVDRVAAAGIAKFYVHARKAWLKGLSPKENRDIPPLDYDLVKALKRARPSLEIHLNGGLSSVGHSIEVAEGLDGVMLGRAAYQTPAILLDVDPQLYGEAAPNADAYAATRAFLPYVERQLERGTPLHAMIRHVLGAFHGRPGGRIWRRTLAEGGSGGLDSLRQALAAVEQAAARTVNVL